MPLTPNNREEHWLQGMVDGSTTLEPNKRREYWYKEIVDAIGSGGGGGTGGGVLVCHINEDTQSLDKTWNEIKSAASTSVVIALGVDEYETNIFILKSVGIDTDDDDNTIYVAAISNLEGYVARYVATSADGYPTLTIG